MGTSTIEWTDKTWNPVVGCSRVSPGCEHCYAETMAARHVLMSNAQGRRSVYLPVVDAQRRRWTREVALLAERLQDPLDYPDGSKVFVVSMGDPFHNRVPFEFVAAMFSIMAACPRVTFQLLTKRPQRMLEFFAWLEASTAGALTECCMHALDFEREAGGERLHVDRCADPDGPWPLPNVWLGVSVEDQQRADERIPLLLEAPAAVRFLSCEPLLGEVDLGRWIERVDHCSGCGGEFEPQGKDLCPTCGNTGPGLITTWGHAQAERYRTGDRYSTSAGERDQNEGPGFHWVITGGESGPGARPVRENWVLTQRDQCEQAGIAFFFKQWGGVNKKAAGRELDGRTHDAMPEVQSCA